MIAHTATYMLMHHACQYHAPTHRYTTPCPTRSRGDSYPNPCPIIIQHVSIACHTCHTHACHVPALHRIIFMPKHRQTSLFPRSPPAMLPGYLSVHILTAYLHHRYYVACSVRWHCAQCLIYTPSHSNRRRKEHNVTRTPISPLSDPLSDLAHNFIVFPDPDLPGSAIKIFSDGISGGGKMPTPSQLINCFSTFLQQQSERNII